MKNKKITTSLLTAGMVLAIGITPFVHSNTMEAATLISQSDHEKVMSFTKKDLKRSNGHSIGAGDSTSRSSGIKATNHLGNIRLFHN